MHRHSLVTASFVAVGVVIVALVLVYGRTDVEPTADASPSRPSHAPRNFAPRGTLVRGSDEVPGAVARILLSREDALAVCVVGGASFVPFCRPVPAPSGASPRLVDTTLDAAVFLALPEGIRVVSNHGLEARAPIAGLGTFVREADTLVLDTVDATSSLTVFDRQGLQTGSFPLVAPPPSHRPWLFGAHVFSAAPGEDEVETLTVRSMAEGGLGEVATLGVLPPRSVALRACRVGGMLVVGAVGDVRHGQRKVALTFEGEGGFSPLVLADATLREPILTCGRGGAALTWVGGTEETIAQGTFVGQSRCTREGCTTATADIAMGGTDPLAVGLGSNVLLSSVHADGVHVRLAAIDALARATDMVLPVAGSVIARGVIAREGFALLWMRTEDGIAMVRLDERGVRDDVLLDPFRAPD